jgi:hypothetical protein
MPRSTRTWASSAALAPLLARDIQSDMPHAFTFFRAGGSDQVRLATAADIAAIGQLDRKLWAALACPVKGLEFDERTLQLVDSDNDGRVRAPEVVAAVDWTGQRLVDLGAIIAGKPRLPLAAIVTATPAGAALTACAKRVLDKAGKATSPDIGLDELATASGDLAKTRFNGDNVLPPASAEDVALAAAITDILTTRPAMADRSGEPGLDRAGLDAFTAQAKAWLAWWDAGQAQAAGLLPLGEATAAALTAVDAVRAKVDDHFLRCRVAGFDPRAAQQLSRTEGDWAALAGKDLGASIAEIAVFPIAAVAAGAPLPLVNGINPAWAVQIEALRSAAVVPLLGARESLSEADWRSVTARLDAFRAWRTTEPPAVGPLGTARLRELTGSAVQDGLLALFAQDEAVKPEFDALLDLERLVRYHRDLYRLLHNFINFADLFDRERSGIFQIGTLFFDGRGSELCVDAPDMARHGLLAGRSNIFLVYCDCVRAGAKRTICAGMTNGDSNGLIVGRNGLFVDRQGRDWDATVVKVVENPISIREAFWSPYKRVLRFVEDFVAKRAAEADKAADSKLAGAAAATMAVATTAPAPTSSAPAPKPKIDVGTVAALGVAVGGITTAIGLMLQAFFGLGYWIPLGVIGLVLLISGPSMAIAWLKLRTRTIGPLLDANGWAVNGRIRINIPFGTAMTRLARLPDNALRQLGDPYAERRQPWIAVIALMLVAAAALWTGWNRFTHGAWWWQNAATQEQAVETP